MARAWRVYHPDLPSVAGASITLEPGESHHLSRVLRCTSGDRVRVFDGCGAEWQAVIETLASSHVVLRLEQPCDDAVESPLALELYQGLCRSDRLEWVIQKGTELGLVAIHLLRCERSAALGLTPARLQRWRRIAVEACKQSGRRRLPRIAECAELPVAEGPTGLALVLDPRARPLGGLLAGAAPARVRLAVGPESGFSAAELGRWSAAGWLAAGLGPRTLRADTAGLVAAAIIQARWGDLGTAGSI